MKHAHHALLLAAVVAGAAPRLAVATTCSTFEPTIPLGCTVVDLRYATIPEAKAALFAAALRNHTTPIAAIELQYSGIGDAVVISIAGVLRHLPALERLDLRYNAITLAGGQALIAVLENCNENRALTELRIGYNEFGWRGKIFTKFNQLLKARGFGDPRMYRACKDVVHVPTMVGVSAVLVLLAVVATWKCNAAVVRPFRNRRRVLRERASAERAYGVAHPLTVTTLAGDKYAVPDWGTSNDLHRTLATLFPELGNPARFTLIGVRVPDVTGCSDTVTPGTPGTSGSCRVSPRPGRDRAQMLAGQIGPELSLVFHSGDDDHLVNLDDDEALLQT